MLSNVARGAYYKSRTRKYFLARGWQVADLEIVRWVYRPGGRPIPVKRDQMGADLLIMNTEMIIFIQVKGGQAAAGQGTFPAARRVFEQFQFPRGVQRWIVAWAPRAREPRIIAC